MGINPHIYQDSYLDNNSLRSCKHLTFSMIHLSDVPT